MNYIKATFVFKQKRFYSLIGTRRIKAFFVIFLYKMFIFKSFVLFFVKLQGILRPQASVLSPLKCFAKAYL